MKFATRDEQVKAYNRCDRIAYGQTPVPVPGDDGFMQDLCDRAAASAKRPETVPPHPNAKRIRTQRVGAWRKAMRFWVSAYVPDAGPAARLQIEADSRDDAAGWAAMAEMFTKDLCGK